MITDTTRRFLAAFFARGPHSELCLVPPHEVLERYEAEIAEALAAGLITREDRGGLVVYRGSRGAVAIADEVFLALMSAEQARAADQKSDVRSDFL